MEQDVTPIGTLIDNFHSLRQQKDKLNKVVKQVDAELDEAKEQLIATMKAIRLEIASGTTLTVSVGTDDVFNITDPDEFLGWAVEHDSLYMLQKRLSAPSVREYRDLHNELPPGLGFFTKDVLHARKR